MNPIRSTIRKSWSSGTTLHYRRAASPPPDLERRISGYTGRSRPSLLKFEERQMRRYQESVVSIVAVAAVASAEEVGTPTFAKDVAPILRDLTLR